MPSFGSLAKYIGLFTIGKDVVDKAVIAQLLSGTIKVIASAVVAAILSGALIIGALAGIYYALISYFPIEEWAAGLIIAIITLMLLASIVYKITCAVKKISAASSILFKPSIPSPLSPVTDIVGAFINGLKSHKQPPEDTKKSLKAVK